MTATKNIYVLMLALVIVLSGCLGGNTVDADESNGNITHALPPSIGYITSDASNYPTVYVYVTSFSNNITDFGVDVDLDGTIDQSINWSSPQLLDVSAGNQTQMRENRCVFTFGLWAMDDQGLESHIVGLRDAECIQS
jgi:hypothetical protein